MKKLIIAIILFICLAVPASAFYYNNALVNLWSSRPDLQKAFPGDPMNNSKLEDWAKKYGWKESTELFNYYPDKAIVEKIVSEKYDLKLKSLEDRINSLENKSPEIVRGSEVTIERIIKEPAGHVIKCCGSKSSAWLKCNDEVQNMDCNAKERTPGDGYTIYIYAE